MSGAVDVALPYPALDGGPSPEPILALERALLGGLLLFPDLLPMVEPTLDSGAAFYHSRHQTVFRAMKNLGPEVTTLSRVTAEIPTRELENMGGPVWVSSLLQDNLVTPGQVLEAAETIARAYRRRRQVAAVAEYHRAVVLNAGDAEAANDRLIRRLDELQAIGAPKLNSLLCASRTYREVIADQDDPEPESLLGDGLLRARQIGQIHGADGSRKSWATLDLLLSAAAGRPWFGLSTRPGGIRCGLASLEDEKWILRDRMRAIVLCKDLDESLLGVNLHLISPPAFDAKLDLTDSAQRELVKAWIRDRELELVVIDHLSLAHDLADERDLRPIANAGLEIARECCCAVLFLHHDRKADPRLKVGTDRGASRGDSRFSAACRLNISMVEVDANLIRLAVEKSTRRQKPAPIWLAQDPESGVLLVTPEPRKSTEHREARIDRTCQLICEAGPDGIEPATLARALGVATRTVTRYAEKLASEGRISRQGEGRAVRYRSLEPGQPESCLSSVCDPSNSLHNNTLDF